MLALRYRRLSERVCREAERSDPKLVIVVKGWIILENIINDTLQQINLYAKLIYLNYPTIYDWLVGPAEMSQTLFIFSQEEKNICPKKYIRL